MNLNQSILVSAAGRPMFAVGGVSARHTFEHKGYVISMEWDETDGEPIMLMWSATAGRDAGVFGICLSSAGKYANADGSPTNECFFECAAALPTLGRGLIDLEVRSLVDVVMRHIPDLLMMPPAPRALRTKNRGEALMDITRTDHRGKTLSEVTL